MENKNEIVETEDCAVVEKESVSKTSKVGAWMKKHGKKVAVGAAIGVGAILLTALGRKKKANDPELATEEDFEDEDEYQDVDSVEEF